MCLENPVVFCSSAEYKVCIYEPSNSFISKAIAVTVFKTQSPTSF